MVYRLPTFNLKCSISQPDNFGIPSIPSAPYRITGQICQLTYGRRGAIPAFFEAAAVGAFAQTMSLLLPPKADIRGPQDVDSFDCVEVPEGSGRWYSVCAVDDIGRGFTNEHRFAQIFAIVGTWVPPYP